VCSLACHVHLAADVWASMGQKDEADYRRQRFKGFQVGFCTAFHSPESHPYAQQRNLNSPASLTPLDGCLHVSKDVMCDHPAILNALRTLSELRRSTGLPALLRR